VLGWCGQARVSRGACACVIFEAFSGCLAPSAFFVWCSPAGGCFANTSRKRDLNLRSGLEGGCKGRVVVCFGVLPGMSGSRVACRREHELSRASISNRGWTSAHTQSTLAEAEENRKMVAEEGHELEGKAPYAQRPTLKIKAKTLFLSGRFSVFRFKNGKGPTLTIQQRAP
jgi:hypothetical protein